MKRAILLLASCLWVSSAAAEEGHFGRVRGFVFAPDGRPVERARIYTDNAEAMTDSEGMFVVRLAEGDYSFVIEVANYPRLQTSAVSVFSGQESEFIVVLSQQGDAQVEVEAPEAKKPVERVQGTETGTVTGVVRSEENGSLVSNARVFVRGSARDARTDKEGRFSLPLPIGDQELTIIHPSFATTTVQVQVSAETLIIEAKLAPKSIELAEMVVVAPALEGGTVFVLQERRQSSNVTDVLGSDQMSKSGDSDAAAALRRVTGITVVGGRYVYVRGLGERYSATLLNRSTLPSPDPEKRVVPLDLFPAGLLSGIVVQKTYSPDLPGEFGGGLVMLKTQEDLPESFDMKLSLSGGYRAGTTLSGAQGYEGGGLDFLTFGRGSRALPGFVEQASREQVFREGNMFGGGYSVSQLESFGEAMDARFNRSELTVPPDQGVSFDVGGPFRLFGFDAGAKAGINWGNSFLSRAGTLNTYNVSSGSELALQNSFENGAFEFQRQAALAALGTIGVDVADDHKVRLTMSMNRIADDTTRYTEGYLEEDNAFVRITRLWWIEQMLLTNQLRGEHVLSDASQLKLNWRYMLSFATRDEPNRREIRYDLDNSGLYNFSLKTSGNQRFYSTLNDINHDVSLDMSLPLEIFGKEESKLDWGAAVLLKNRRVDSRRYRYDLNGDDATRAQIRTLDADRIFSNDTIGPGLFELEEVTLPDDNYLGDQQIVAGYAMGDVAFREDLRLLIGTRLEFARIGLETRTPLAAEGENTVASSKSNVDLLPAATLTYSLSEEMKLRFGAARTVNRPNFRELSPARFFDVTIGAEFRGNPNLQRATITHFDLRWEWYPSDSESISIAAFAKLFNDPIENTVNGGSSWIFIPSNVDAARNLGIEFEARKNFGFLDDVLENLYTAANLTLVSSKVDIGVAQLGILTSSSRALQGQSPYAFNLQLGWDDIENETAVSVLFNVFARRIDSVGALGIPDIYEESFPELEIVGRKKFGRFALSAKASNLLDSASRKTIRALGGEERAIVENYQKGRVFSLGLGVDLD